MAKKTGIEWTHTFLPDGTSIPGSTWNPVRGCSRVSEGCRNCYAERVASRFSGPGQPYEGLVQLIEHPDGRKEPRWTGEVRCIETALYDPIRKSRKGGKIFVNSMADLFHPRVPMEYLDRVFAVMALCPGKTFQILTKREIIAHSYLNGALTPKSVMRSAEAIVASDFGKQQKLEVPDSLPWPLPNVWMGVSVENQEEAFRRMPVLRAMLAAVRFVSYEPALGLVDFSPWLFEEAGPDWAGFNPAADIDWIIAGGESGPEARPINVNWMRSVRNQCLLAKCAFFLKQWGQWLPGEYDGANPIYQSANGDPIPNSEIRHEFEDGTFAVRVPRKSDAGRYLDGELYHEFPDVSLIDMEERRTNA